jgi:hypothetical protein
MAQASDGRHGGDIREKAQAMLIYVLNSSPQPDALARLLDHRRGWWL